MTNRLRLLGGACCLSLPLILLLPGIASSDDDLPVVRVGMRGQLKGVVLPGPELEVKPLEDSQAPLVLRIIEVYRHGTAFRYDFVYYALEPRSYDLTQYLRPKGGAAAQKLPPVEVEVKGLLGPGLIHPHALEPKPTSWIAGYRLLLMGSSAVWGLGLLLILFWGRRKRKKTQENAEAPANLADRLRPLVVRAMTGMLSASQQAELERTLLAFWRQRLGLEQEKAPEAMAKIRQHPEAGALFDQLELWLHRPGTAEKVDLGKLLWPYQQASVEDFADTHGAIA